MKADKEKTNVMRLLEQKKISYQSYCYDGDASTLTGVVTCANAVKPAQDNSMLRIKTKASRLLVDFLVFMIDSSAYFFY